MRRSPGTRPYLTALLAVLALETACSDTRASAPAEPVSPRAAPLGASPEFLASARDEFADGAAAELQALRTLRMERLGDAPVPAGLLREERAAERRLAELRAAAPREWTALRPGMRRSLEDLRAAVEALASRR